jgi:hypothetical protein
MGNKKPNYSGWWVMNKSHILMTLASTFPAEYPNVYLDHITHKYPDFSSLEPVDAYIIGYVKNEYIQAFIVSINGNTIRPDGKTYHITYSVAEGHKPVESNKAIENAKQNNSIVNFDKPIKVITKSIH